MLERQLHLGDEVGEARVVTERVDDRRIGRKAISVRIAPGDARAVEREAAKVNVSGRP